MMADEIHHIRAEIAFLKRHLADLPDRARVTRMSTKSRIGNLEMLLADLQTVAPVKRLRLTFRGRPVVGSHGIFASFGAGSLDRFSRAIALLAAGQSGELGARGPIPDRGASELLVVGATVGSFGFELEEYQPNDPAPTLESGIPSSVAVAMEQAQALLAGAAGTDDELAEAASGIDPRGRRAVQEFLAHVAGQEGVCAIEYGDHTVRFADVAQVHRAAERLGESVRQTDEELVGAFLGVLPIRRAFEFREAATEVVIAGKLGPTVRDADTLNEHLNQETNIKVCTTRVGAGKPRYVLREMPVFA
jgi:hypothetical protein